MSVAFRKCLLEPNLLVNLAKSTTIPSKKFSTKEPSKREIPKCSYVLSPTQWLKNKINFQRLKMYDKDFNEKEFISGAKQVNTNVLTTKRQKTFPHRSTVSCLHILQHNFIYEPFLPTIGFTSNSRNSSNA